MSFITFRCLSILACVSFLSAAESALAMQFLDADKARGEARTELRKAFEALPNADQANVLHEIIRIRPHAWTLRAWSVRNKLSDVAKLDPDNIPRLSEREEWDDKKTSIRNWILKGKQPHIMHKRGGGIVVVEDPVIEVGKVGANGDFVSVNIFSVDDQTFRRMPTLVEPNSPLCSHPDLALSVLLDLLYDQDIAQADVARRFWFAQREAFSIRLGPNDFNPGFDDLKMLWPHAQPEDYTLARLIRRGVLESCDDPSVAFSLALMEEDAASSVAYLQFRQNKDWPGILGPLLAYGRMYSVKQLRWDIDYFHGKSLDEWLISLDANQWKRLGGFMVDAYRQQIFDPESRRSLARDLGFFSILLAPVLRHGGDKLSKEFRDMTSKYINDSRDAFIRYCSRLKNDGEARLFLSSSMMSVPILPSEGTLHGVMEIQTNIGPSVDIISWAKQVLQDRDGELPTAALLEQAYRKLKPLLEQAGHKPNK